MSNLCNFDAYISRMNASLKNKIQMVKYFPQNPLMILDFGCGSGSLANAVSHLYPNAFVMGYDESSKMVKTAKHSYPHIFFSDNVNDVHLRKWDVILLSSVLHEVYSYAPTSQRGFVVQQFINSMRNRLNNGGKVIVRDGLADHFQSNEIITISPIDSIDFTKFISEYERDWIWRKDYIKQYGNNGDVISINGKINSVKELMNKYTWGFDSLPREVHEQIYFADLNRYLSYSQGKIDYEIITDHEYFNYLRKKVVIDREWITHIIIAYSEGSI